jgi:hypothetical protein
MMVRIDPLRQAHSPANPSERAVYPIPSRTTS